MQKSTLFTPRKLHESRHDRPGYSSWEGYYLETHPWLLHLVLSLGNDRGGTVWMVLDATEIGGLRQEVVWNIFPVALMVLLLGTAR